MRYLALCTDYDGTLAHHGRVDKPTIAALEELRASGRKLIMVTGREMADLVKVFDRLDLFELVVAENGATIYRPASMEERSLADAPPARATSTDARPARGTSKHAHPARRKGGGIKARSVRAAPARAHA